MGQPAARIKVNRAWVGAPDGALLGNPTVWLFVAAAVALTQTTVFREIRPELEARGSRIGWAVEPLPTS